MLRSSAAGDRRRRLREGEPGSRRDLGDRRGDGGAQEETGPGRGDEEGTQVRTSVSFLLSLSLSLRPFPYSL